MQKKIKIKTKLKKIKSNGPKIKKNKEELYGPIIIEEVVEPAKVDRESSNEQVHLSNDENTTPNYSFEFNRKYFMICVYTLATISIGAFIIYCIVNLPVLKTAIGNFFKILSPFIAAFFIAFIINPLAKYLERKFFLNVCKIKSIGVRLSLSILVSYIVVLGLLVVGLVFVIPQIINSITDLTARVPQVYEEIISFLDNIEDYVSPEFIAFIEEKLSEVTPTLITFGTNLAKNLFPMIIDVPFYIVKVAINIFLAIAISIYMLYDKRMLSKHVTRFIYAITSRKKADAIVSVSKDCSAIFSSYVVGKSVDSLIIGIICFVAMLALKLPYAVLMSVIVGVTNMIPYFGPFIGAVPGVLLYLCFDPVKALIFAIMILILQQFDGWILGPKILGDSTGLTPLWVIFGITVGGAYWGVIGMFLGVPIVAVIAYLFNLFITSRLKKKNLNIK